MEQLAKEAASKNMALSYQYKNHGLEIKIKTMGLLYRQVELLAEKSQNCEGEELYRIQELMAMLGQAIIPD